MYVYTGSDEYFYSYYENKDADQFRGNRESDQCLCFRYTDSTSHVLHKSKTSSLQPFSVLVQLVSDLFENDIVGFLLARLI